MCAVGIASSGLAPTSAIPVLAGLIIAGMGASAALPMFWQLPPAFLSDKAQAAGIGLISSFGSIASFLAPYLIGWMRDTTQSASLALFVLAFFIALGAGLVLRTPPPWSTHAKRDPTMLDATLIQQAAARLDAAERSRQQIRQFSLDHPGITIEDAYAIQRAWVAQKISDGASWWATRSASPPAPCRCPPTSPSRTTARCWMTCSSTKAPTSPSSASSSPRGSGAGLRLGKLRGPNVTLFDVLDATEWVIPALEIIDARIQQVDPETQATRKVFDTISDNAANAGVVMGGRAVRPTEIDLRRVPAVLYRNGVIEESGVSAAVLNHPAKGVAWLANKPAPYDVPWKPGRSSSAAPSPARWPPAPATPSMSTMTSWARLPVGLSELELEAWSLKLEEKAVRARFQLPASSFQLPASSFQLPEPPMPLINTFKHRLQSGDAQVGLWLGLADPYCAELAANAGFDWLLIDGEHAPNDLRSLLGQLQAVAPYPAKPIIRPPIGDPVLIKQLLDIGVQTLLVPMVDSAAQAAELVRAMRYPPFGIRGVGSAPGPCLALEQHPRYLDKADEQMCLLVQIENLDGLANLDAIAAVEGVDGVFIGPADLSAAMGHRGNPGHPEVQAAIEDAIAASAAPARPSASSAPTRPLARRYLELGCSFVAVGVDTSLLMKALQGLAGRFKGTPAPPSSTGSVY